MTVGIHPATGLRLSPEVPESLSDDALKLVNKRVARKAGYSPVSGNVFAPCSKLERFTYFSEASRNMHSTARAHYESGHLLGAALIREDYKIQREPATKNTPQRTIWGSFKNNKAIQRNFKRQDYITHRLHMLESGEKTTAAGEVVTTQGNQQSRIATKFARASMSACECTSAPTGFTYKIGRNTVFHGVTDKGLNNKAGTVAASFAIGMGATAIIKSLRGAAGSGGYGFNPFQMLTGVLVAFAAVSAFAGLVSWISGLVSQSRIKNLDLNDEQKQYIEFEINSTLNKINQLLISSKDNKGKMYFLHKALDKHLPSLERNANTGKSTLVTQWIEALTAFDTQNQHAKQPITDVKELTAKRLTIAKKTLGKYLTDLIPEADEHGNALTDTHREKLERQGEKVFAALAGMVEHYQIEQAAPSEKDHENATQAAKEAGLIGAEGSAQANTRRKDRIDARQFAEEFGQRINRGILKTLVHPAKLLDKVFHTQGKMAQKMRDLSNPKYAKIKADRLKDPRYAHRNRFDTEYISANMHQYGPITRALMNVSNLVHSVNYNYFLAVNAQTSRLFNKLAQWGQERVLGQHSSKISCSAFGRFMGGAVVTLVSFFGISAAASLSGGGSPADGFQNSSELGSARLNWLVTGTLMTLIGIPAFALGLMAKGAVALEGWKGDIGRPISNKLADSGKLKTA